MARASSSRWREPRAISGWWSDRSGLSFLQPAKSPVHASIDTTLGSNEGVELFFEPLESPVHLSETVVYPFESVVNRSELAVDLNEPAVDLNEPAVDLNEPAINPGELVADTLGKIVQLAGERAHAVLKESPELQKMTARRG
jgi:hypothetical protein